MIWFFIGLMSLMFMYSPYKQIVRESAQYVPRRFVLYYFGFCISGIFCLARSWFLSDGYLMPSMIVVIVVATVVFMVLTFVQSR